MLRSKQENGNLAAYAAQDANDYQAAKALRAQALKEAQWAAAVCGVFALWQLFEQRPWLRRLAIDRVGSRLRALLKPAEGFLVEGWESFDKEQRRDCHHQIDAAIERLSEDLAGLPWTSHAQRWTFERPREIDQLAHDLFFKKKPDLWARWEARCLAKSASRANEPVACPDCVVDKNPAPALRLVEGGLSSLGGLADPGGRVVSAKKAPVRSEPKPPWLKPDLSDEDDPEGRRKREGGASRARRL